MPRYLVNWRLDERRTPVRDRGARWERGFAREVGRRVGAELKAYQRDRKTGCGSALFHLPEPLEDLGAALRGASQGAILQIMITRVNGRARMRKISRVGCDALVSAAGGAGDAYKLEHSAPWDIDRAA